MDTLDYLDKRRDRQSDDNLQRNRDVMKQQMESDKNNIKREEIQARKDITRASVEVARTNKNKYDKPAPKKK
jgi:hypothetical protein